MPFFAPLQPEPPQPPPQRRDPPVWIQAPHDQIPATVPAIRCLARTPNAALHLQRLDVYREGVELALRFDIRAEPKPPEPLAEHLEAMLNGRPRGRDPRLQPRFGIEFADGRRAEMPRQGVGGIDGAGVAGRFYTALGNLQQPSGPTLGYGTRGGGGGGDGTRWSSDFSLWLWPLPPSGGPTLLHFVIPALEIDEGSTSLDTDAILAASTGVIDVWGTDE